MQNHLSLRSHGVETPYRVVEALYHLTSDGRLNLSVAAEVADSTDDVPRDLSIAVRNVPYEGEDSVLEVEDIHESWGEDDESPHAYVYSGFHHTRVQARARLSKLANRRLLLVVDITTDDVRFYDERAKDSMIAGSVALQEAGPADLWAP